MLLYITEDTFVAPATDQTNDAIRFALQSRDWGYCRILVSPRAAVAARIHGLHQFLAEGLDVVQRGWLEGQSLLNQLDRVVALVGDGARHGVLRGNIYEVATDKAVALGVFKEPALVTENMATDGAFVALLFRFWNGVSAEELERFWEVRFEQGGGDAIRNYVSRYINRPEPMALVCDRDSGALPSCGGTVRNCVGDMVAQGLFPSRDHAKSGGFSPSAVHFAFEVLHAWSLECFVMPHMVEVMLDSVMNGTEASQRRQALTAAFPGYPNLSEQEAEAWLSTDFKRFLGGRSAWNSSTIQRLSVWSSANEENFDTLRTAFGHSCANPVFGYAINKLCSTISSLGIRDKRLM